MKLKSITNMIFSVSTLRQLHIFPLLATLLPLPAFAFNSLRGSVENSGIYSVDYAALRAAGFNDPEKVGARGTDGAIPVLHRDGRVIMWIQGVDSFSYLPDASTGGYFVNNGRDIYCNERVIYFTDNPDYFLPIEVSTLLPSGDPIERGVAFTAYEKDLYHNNTGTGNLFWGENLNISGGASYEWTIDLPSVPAATSGHIGMQLYSTADNGTLRVCDGTGSMKEFTVKRLNSIIHKSNSISSEITLNPGVNTVAIEFDNKGEYAKTVNLDYWILSYPCVLDADFISSLRMEGDEDGFSSSLSSGLTGIPALRNYQEGYIETGNDDIVAFDLSFTLPSLRPSHDGKIALKGNGAPLTLSFCNLSRPLPSPALAEVCEEERWPDVSILSAPADLLIISPRWLSAKAEEIADIHRTHDGLSVTTLILDDIYTLHSAGNPSIEAVRKTVKAVKDASGGRLKNLLLAGPMSCDMRSCSSDSIFIAPQSANVNLEHGAYCTLERYVIDEDTDNNDRLMRETLDLGVAILPFESVGEADRYIGKIREYLENPFSLSSLESTLLIGGEGDHHTHEDQTFKLANTLDRINGEKSLHSMLPIDSYGFPQARKRMFDLLDEGKLFTVYIGHSAENYFGKFNNSFLSPANLLTLHNIPLTFIITAGCSTTETDCRMRGLAEHMILTSDNGAFGGLLTTRQTWSSQNYNFLTNFFNTLYQLQPADPKGSDETTPTVGEVFAQAKTLNKDSNELAFVLMCDPALKLPVATYGVDWHLSEPLTRGKDVKVEGEIISHNGKLIDNFNGRAMVRLMAPPISLVTRNLTTGLVDTTKKVLNGETLIELNEVTRTYDDRVIAVRETEVREGRFAFNFPLPDSALPYADEGIRLYFTALDDSNEGGAASYSTTLPIDTDSPEEQQSLRPASISALRYDPVNHRLAIDVDYDERRHFALETDPEILIDGTSYRYTGGLVRFLENDGYGLTFLTPLPALREGTHMIEVSLRDIAGNLLSISEMISTDTTLPLHLSIAEAAVREEATFSHDAPSEGDTRLMIETAEGLPVSHLEVKDTTFSWDRKDNAGRLLPAGIYRCYLRHAATDGTLSFSLPISITLL